ncbi:hypothetical protein FAES_4495 [Fibrella aestuarina BUZ 2]|uniref:Carboxypeptidase-like regulatory domain-containing protein n=1 Tax=Fibrella aestuarina BUZ 2 TaxID=1166018 RepID=I0KEE1_9BACT|nr:hypothetical protein [Fibrella aestuarina]CCH02494.1 hypothetical protein FAES_4495 [Fibrella aestuarina BUZ 2]
MSIRFLLVACFFLLANLTALAQTPRFIIGKVLDQENGKGVNNATVINPRTQAIGRTNTLGAFYLEVKPGDSVIVTSPSHGRAGLKWDGVTKEPQLAMKRQLSDDVVNLPTLTVRGKREAEVRKELEQILREPEARKNLSVDEAFSLAQSPITLLYELFSKQARASRKAAVISQQHRKRMLANYRVELIAQRATDLQGEAIEQFRDYCNFNDDFVLQSSEYDLTFALLQRYKQYSRR